MSHLRALFFQALLLLGLSVLAHAEAAKVAFLDVWDRSMPTITDACREAGVGATFFKSADFVKLDAKGASEFPLVLVLNLDATQSPALTARLKESHALNPGQRILPLDNRGSHVDLDKAGLLQHDEALMAYWKPNGPVNLKRMMRYLLVHYLGGTGEIEPAVMIPESGYYDPEREEVFENFDSCRQFKIARKRWIEGASTAVLIIQQSFWITRDLKVVDAQIAALERHGLNVVVVFGDREDKVRPLVEAAKPDVLVEDRHGGLWNDNGFLKQLDVPYLRPISMLGSTVEEWKESRAGLAPRDIGMFMALQESWGTLEPLVVGGLKANIQGFRLHEPIPDRVEAFAARAARWASLHEKANADKKLAIIYYNKSLGQDDFMRGSPTGGFLDGPESAVRFLAAMKKDGYTLKDLPATSAELIERIRKGGRNIGPWAQGDLEKMADEGDPVLIPLSTYLGWFNGKLSEANRKAVVDAYGPPPGRLMVVTRNGEPQIVLPQIRLGNLTLTPQPERGEKQDEKLLHSRDTPPPHNYLAFYWWLDEQYKADAIVHWGTHGSLELLPGKESGLSSECWSDICVGKLPVIDLWITDNLGEATLARRRSYAELVDHLPPPAVGAGLNDAFKNLHEEIHKFRTLEGGLLKEEFRKNITKLAEQEHFQDVASPGSDVRPFPDEAIVRLDDHLHNLYESQTPVRLHVLGEPPVEADMMPYLVSILGESFRKHLSEILPPAPAGTLLPDQELRDRAAGFLRDALENKLTAGTKLTPELEKDIAAAREMRDKLMKSGNEIEGLLKALKGRYVEAGPGPDPIRNPSTVPGGRNLYSLNPEEIPNRAAWNVACQLVDELLKTRHPKKIGMDLNGMETMRDFGVMEGQILYLLGVRPVWNQSNLVIDVEMIPAEELKRPRVEVFIAMGGQYKENFPSRVTLLDKAVRLAAAAKEPVNPLRDSVAAMELRLRGKGFTGEDASRFAAARIFGTKPGNLSGTNILYLIPRSGVWDNPDDISSVYMDNMSFVYTKDTWGEKVDGLYEEALQGTDTVLRVWASNMTSQLSNHHAYEYLGGLSMAVKKVTGAEPQAVISDVRDPSGAKIRDFGEVLATNFRSELLNRKWIEGMKEHDYAGAGHIAELVKNTFGWSVTRPESVSQGTWNDIYEVYVKDREKLGLNEWFERVSPHALQEVTATLLEASRKGIWHATEEQIRELTKLYAESVSKHGDSEGLVSGGNTKLQDYVTQQLVSTGQAPNADLAKAMNDKIASSAKPGGETKVSGKKLESVTPPPLAPQVEAQPAEAPPLDLWRYAMIALVGLLLVAGFVSKSGAP